MVLDMNLISRRTVNEFCKKHPAAQKVMSAWCAIVRKASWSSYADVKATFNSADAVGDGKVIFDVGGNKYRIVCLVGYRAQRMFVLWIGTHAEYDNIDVKEL